jgi:hypothetical protein
MQRRTKIDSVMAVRPTIEKPGAVGSCGGPVITDGITLMLRKFKTML